MEPDIDENQGRHGKAESETTGPHPSTGRHPRQEQGVDGEKSGWGHPGGNPPDPSNPIEPLLLHHMEDSREKQGPKNPIHFFLPVFARHHQVCGVGPMPGK